MNKTYLNKTRLYLLPCFEHYGEDFWYHFHALNPYWIGIGDKNLIKNYSLFCLFTIKQGSLKHLNYFRSHFKYVTDYLIDDPLYAQQHMIVVNVPDKFKSAYDHFINSKYSKMYNKSDLNSIFAKNDPRFGNPDLKLIAKLTLEKNPLRKEKFEQMVNSLSKDQYYSPYLNYNTAIELNEECELDFQWKPKHEIFNHEKHNLGNSKKKSREII